MKPLTHTLGNLAKPSALRHAQRLINTAKHDKPEFDPRDSKLWLTKDGRFTLPALSSGHKTRNR